MKLAVVGIIELITPIVGANNIQQARVRCGDAGIWSGVCGKDIVAGEKVTVFLQDALLPPNERWAFMEHKRWRIRICRFMGAPSECLIVQGCPDLPIGTDLTQALGVTKYEKPIPENMAGEVIGTLPSIIPKTDEPNYQTLDWRTLLASAPWYATEKADGTSCTVWRDEAGVLHVASRNWDLKAPVDQGGKGGESNIYWEVARRYDWSKLPSHVAAQFEVVGAKVQGNPMGIVGHRQGRLFTLYDYQAHQRLSRPVIELFAQTIGIPTVALIAAPLTIDDEDQLRALANIQYPNGKAGEGVVIRDIANTWSFKVINLEYKN